MKPLAGYIVGVKPGLVTVKLETGNTREIRTDKSFKKYDKVRISFNFNAGTVRSIELASTPPKGTEICSRCAQTYVEFTEEDGFEGDID